MRFYSASYSLSLPHHDPECGHEVFAGGKLTSPDADDQRRGRGQTVQIIVQAVHGKLQGVASEPIQFTVLLVKQNTKATVVSQGEAQAIDTTASTTNGSNGHANGTRLPAFK